MKIYKAAIVPIYAFMATVFLLFAIFLVIRSLTGGVGPLDLSIAAFCMGLFLSYWYYRIPFEIRVGDDGGIQFRSAFRKITVLPRDIKAITAGPLSNLVHIEHRGGFVHLISYMDGLDDFLKNLKAANSSIEIIGC